ncbi:MAG: transglycosylase domain-containing protein, partial [Cyanobacteria bacterium J06636_16]
MLLALALSVRGAAYLVPIQAEDLAQVDQAIEFRDRNFRPLGTLLSRDQEHTAVVSLAQVSPHFRRAILAAEDQRFYQHGAVDWQAVIRSSWQAMQSRRIVSGASTITMQLARMVDPVPRTFSGKVQQVWQAWRLTAGMSKDEILAAYINRLPMGGNIYGIEAAARGYFGVSAADLTLAQSSLLAALPNAPSALDPYTHWNDLKPRQRYVLDRMVDDGHLTKPQADRAYTQHVTLQLLSQSLPTAPH